MFISQFGATPSLHELIAIAALPIALKQLNTLEEGLMWEAEDGGPHSDLHLAAKYACLAADALVNHLRERKTCPA